MHPDTSHNVRRIVEARVGSRSGVIVETIEGARYFHPYSGARPVRLASVQISESYYAFTR